MANGAYDLNAGLFSEGGGQSLLASSVPAHSTGSLRDASYHSFKRSAAFLFSGGGAGALHDHIGQLNAPYSDIPRAFFQWNISSHSKLYRLGVRGNQATTCFVV
jgi:hypothetical protein